MRLIDRVRTFARRHALWQADTRVLTALSGGADSVALLLILHELAAAGDLVLDAAVHLNHATRGRQSDHDEDFCRTLCARMEVPLLTRRVDIRGVARHDRLSVEVAARRERQRFYLDSLRERAAHVVATAHSADDQAETVLLRLVRGAGGRGLSGMAPRRQHLIRPLLTVPRRELRELLTARGQTWCEDASNTDLDNPRNRVRHELLPYLAAHFNPAISRALGRLADVIRADEACLERSTEVVAQAALHVEGEQVSVDVSALSPAPLGIARRIARRALETANPERSYSVEEVDHLLAIAAGERISAEIAGLRVERFRDSAVLIQRAPAVRPRRRGVSV